MNSTSCNIEGNPDLYGLGVRIGTYLQWVSSMIILNVIPTDQSFARSITTIFAISLYSGLLLLNSTHQLFVVEPVIALWLLTGTFASLILNDLNLSLESTVESRIIRLALYAATSGYFCWYWFQGLSLLKPMPCRSIVFFGQCDLYGPIRTVSEVAAVITIVLSGCLLLIFIGVYVYTQIRKQFGMRTLNIPEPTTELTLLIGCIALVVLPIAGTEYTIEANNITAVDEIMSVGQLIPLLTGIFSLLSIYPEARDGILKTWSHWTILGYRLKRAK